MDRPELVGRDAEFGFLAASLSRALHGAPGLVVVEGQPGIGKTRLAEELLDHARREGALGVRAVADDFAGAPPYAPWIHIIRTIARTIPLQNVIDQESTAALAPLGSGVFPAGEAVATVGSAAEDRFRLFDAVTGLLGRVCEHRPLTLVLDDVQWADEASLLLLLHLVRRLTEERILVLANVREGAQQHRQLLARLVREPVTSHLALRGLSASAIRCHLAVVSQRPVSDRDATDVHRMTGGNPLFVAEVARAMADGDAVRDVVLTAGIRDAVIDRLARLPAAAIRLAHAAAVLGEEFAAAVLAGVVGEQPEELSTGLGALQGAGLVEQYALYGRFRFPHALIRDAVAADLPQTTRTALHRSAARVLERQAAAETSPVVFEIARHWAAVAAANATAEDAGRAARWLERAGDVAFGQLAHEQAARLYRAALDLGGASLGDHDRFRLLLAAGASCHWQGDLGGRLDACLDAAAIARRLDRPDLLAQTALVMGATGLPGFDLPTRRLCREALDLMDDEPASLRARVTARFAETFVYLPDDESALRASEHALQLAEACSDRQALAAALHARRSLRAGPEGLAERARLAERTLRLGHECADPELEMSGLKGRIDVRFERGDLAGVAADIEALSRCAGELGGPVALFTVLHSRAALAQAQCRLDDARRLAEQAVRVAEPTDYPNRHYVRAAVLGTAARHRGFDASAGRAAGYADAPEGIDENAGLIAALAQAQALLTAGRVDEAWTIYRAQGPARGWESPPHVRLLCHAIGIDVAARLGAPADLAELHDRLAPWRAHHVVCGLGAVSYLGPVELWLGVADRELGRLDDAVAELEHASQVCDDNGALGFAVEARYELATTLIRRGHTSDLSQARAVLSGAGASAARLGMAPFTASISALREELDPAGGPPVTRRELEVAALVAAGLTNRQIAARLFLSERTAQNHVQHLLTKLGASTRTQVAVWYAGRE